MNESDFNVALLVEDQVSELKNAMAALNFWAMHFDNDVDNVLVGNDDQLIVWACKNHGPGCLAAFHLVMRELNESMDRLSKLSNQLLEKSTEEKR